MRVVTGLALVLGLLAPSAVAADEDAFDFKTLKARAAKSKFDLRNQLATKQYDQSLKTNGAKRDRAMAEARAVFLLELRDAREAAFKSRNSQEIARLEKAMELVKKSAVPASAPSTPATPPTKSVTIPRDAVKWKGHYYKFITEPRRAYHALQACTETGGHLARAETADEDEFLRALAAKSASSEIVWIDGNRYIDQRTWKYSNGERMQYFNWAGGKPSGVHGHVALSKEAQWKWTDHDGRAYFPYICEWEPSGSKVARPDPGKNKTIDVTGKWLRNGGTGVALKSDGTMVRYRPDGRPDEIRLHGRWINSQGQFFLLYNEGMWREYRFVDTNTLRRIDGKFTMKRQR